jgi:hypothetical protein
MEVMLLELKQQSKKMVITGLSMVRKCGSPMVAMLINMSFMEPLIPDLNTKV